MKSFLLALVFPLVALSQSQELMMGQTVTIVSPASSVTMSGFQYPLTATLSGITSADSCEWQIDGERIIHGIVYNAGLTTCPTTLYNSTDFGNGPHKINVIVRDKTNVCIAVAFGSCPSGTDSPMHTFSPLGGQAFTISNTNPCNGGNVVSAGTGYSTATGLATTGGSGTGLTLNITTNSGNIATAVVNNGGSGYTAGDVVTVVQGGGSGGAVNITFPVYYNAQPVITPSTAFTSTWSGEQTIVVSSTGTQCGSYPWVYTMTYDGAPYQIINGTSSGGTFTIETQKLYNAGHWLGFVAQQSFSATLQLMWSAQFPITTSNTGGNLVPLELTVPGKQMVQLVTSGSAVTLSGTEIANDGTTTARTPNCAPVVNIDGTSTAPVTISSSCTLTPGGSVGVGQIIATSPTYTGSDLHSDGSNPNGIYFASNSVLPKQYMIGWTLQVTGGTGWTQAVGTIETIQTGSCTPCRMTIYNISDGTSLSLAALNTAGGSYVFGPTNSVLVRVSAANAVPHFTANGGESVSFVANSSIFSLVPYNSGNGGPLSYPTWLNDMVAAGWNTLEMPMPCGLPGGALNLSVNSSTTSPSGLASFTKCSSSGNEAAWVSNFTTQVASFVTQCETVGCYVALISTSWTGLAAGDTEIFDFTNPAGAGYQYSTNVWTHALNLLNARGQGCTPTLIQRCYGSTLFLNTTDEVDGEFGVDSHPGNLLGSSSSCGTANGICAPNTITGSAGTCTMAYPNIAGSVGLGASGRIILTSFTGSSALNLTSPTTYATGGSAPNITFPCSFTGVANSSTDATGSINVWAASWVGGTTFVTNNAITYAMSIYPTFGGTYSPNVTWPTRGAAFYTAGRSWMGSTLANFATYYYTYPQNFVGMMVSRQFAFQSMIDTALDTGIVPYSLQDAAQPAQLRKKLPYSPVDGKPLCVEGQGISGDFAQSGALNMNVQTGAAITASASGDIITTSGDHGLRGIVPGVTRAKLSSTSTGGDAGVYIIRSTPDSTHIQVVGCPQAAGGIDCSGRTPLITSAGTLHFDNGDTETWHLSTIFGGGLGAAFGGVFGKASDIGHTFTVSGSGTAWDSLTGWYGTGSDPTASTFATQFYSVPSLSSATLNLEILPDNNYYQGFSVGTPINGAPYTLINAVAPAIQGATCRRDYLAGAFPQPMDPVNLIQNSLGSRTVLFDNYGEMSSQTNQVGAFPIVNMAGSQFSWFGHSAPDWLLVAHPDFFLQPWLIAPNLGYGYMEACHGDGGTTTGNVCLYQSGWNTTKQITVPLTAFELSSQAVWRAYSEPLTGLYVTQIAAGTATDVVNCGPYCTIAYFFPKTGASWITQPNYCLPTVSPATATSVRYDLINFPFTQIDQYGAADALIPVATVTNCGTIPVDPSVPTYLQAFTSKTVTGAVIPVSVGAWHK